MKKWLSVILLLFVFTIIVYSPVSAARNDSLPDKHLIMADLLPLYYNFFDSKIQYRLGAGYSHYRPSAYFIAHQIDFGVYDKYTFTKYFNLFNENSGLYYEEHKVFIAGVHYVPSFNFYLVRTRPHTLNCIFSGIALDVSYYHKQFIHYNSAIGSENESHYRQVRTGAGVLMGSRYQFSKRFFTEMKMSFFTNVICYKEAAENNPIRSIPSLWTRNDYQFWLSANICVGYVFN